MRYLVLMLFLPFSVLAKEHPDCSSPNNWAGTMAFVQLKNERLIHNKDIDLSKTVVNRITSQEIKDGLFRQVHEVHFHKKNKQQIKVLTVNNASHEECSMGPVTVHVISKTLGGK